MGKVYLDFEYNSSSNRPLNTLCVSILSIKDEIQKTHNIWLQEETGKQKFRDLVESYIADSYIFVAFSVPAEARSTYALGIDPRRIKWIDLQVEYRMLMNHNHKYSCGYHLIDGKRKYVKPPVSKWEKTEEDKGTSQRAQASLASCIYKFLGIDINLENKDKMRDLILSKNVFSPEERRAIMIYCASDVVHLPELLKRMLSAVVNSYHKEDRTNLKQEILLRGEYGARSAVMEEEGYPIDYQATRSFSDSVEPLLYELQKEIASEFPEINPFLSNKKETKFVQKQKNIQRWVKAQNHARWRETNKGSLSLSLDAFEDHYSSSGDQRVFGNKFVKYLRTKQSLYGFVSARNGKTFWSFVGKDARVRPYFGIYGSQSSRSQPSATGYIFLKSKWMRSLVEPNPGKAIVGIDYSQQEFLIAALLSQDKNMLQAYTSGDVYFYTAKLAGAVPWEAERKDNETIRDKFKSTTLGIQYLMTKFGLAKKLTADTGIPHDEDEAEDLINKFYTAYSVFEEWQEKIYDEYVEQGYLKLPCGWTMYGDNKNHRSVSNFPIQGFGASIMRKAVALAQDNGLNVIMTLHDALYIECDSSETLKSLDTLAVAMSDAFKFYFRDTGMELYANCRMDPSAWSPDFNGETVKTSIGDCKMYEKYVDERGREDYEKYKKYFEIDDLALL